MLLQTQNASKQMVDFENKPETSTEDEKKEQTFGLRTDQYAKKGLQVVLLDCVFKYYRIHWLSLTLSEKNAVINNSCSFCDMNLLIW